MKYEKRITRNIILIGIISVVHVFGQQWSGRQQLDPNGIMSLSWKNEPHQITMELVGKTTGYVGLGISPHGTMKDADLAIGWVENGTPILVDAYSTNNAEYEIDANNNYKLINGASSENGTHTTITFSRLLKTGDPKDRDIESGPMTFIYAYHEKDPVNENAIHHHGFEPHRGAVKITLF